MKKTQILSQLMALTFFATLIVSGLIQSVHAFTPVKTLIPVSTSNTSKSVSQVEDLDDFLVAIERANDSRGAEPTQINIEGEDVTIDLTGTSILLRKSVEITGSGASKVTIIGSGRAPSLTFDGNGNSIEVTIQGVRLANAVSAACGGALLVKAGVTLNVNEVIFEDNEAGLGAAICNDGGRVNVVRSSFRHNHATDEGGAAIYSSGELTVDQSSFVDNYTDVGHGGALLLAKQSVLRLNPLVQVSDSSFARNIAGGSGGAIFNQQGLVLLNNTLVDNTAQGGEQ